MSGLWLISYISLWLLVLFLTIIVIGLVRQLGLIYIRLGPEEHILPTSNGLKIGSSAPEFSEIDVRKKISVSLANLKGRQSILVFVAPSCSPCQELLPHIVSFHQLKNGKINLLVISQADNQISYEMAKTHKIRIPVIADPEGLISRAYQVRATPFAYRLDENTIVRRQGIVNNMEGLNELLEPPPADEEPVNLPSEE